MCYGNDGRQNPQAVCQVDDDGHASVLILCVDGAYRSPEAKMAWEQKNWARTLEIARCP